ncbi:MAG TPA: DUF6370 family protein [Polyangia bacterium]|nr:DUF6370 family protein [Polyangia bacterium]
MPTPRTLTLALLVSLAVSAGPARARAGEPPSKAAAPAPGDTEVTLKGTLGCAKCSFHEAKACQNVLKVDDGAKVETYVLADNEVSRANHEKVCGPSSPATVTGVVSKNKSKKDRRKVLTASAIRFDAP